jgi:hypothetical protein
MVLMNRKRYCRCQAELSNCIHLGRAKCLVTVLEHRKGSDWKKCEELGAKIGNRTMVLADLLVFGLPVLDISDSVIKLLRVVPPLTPQ